MAMGRFLGGSLGRVTGVGAVAVPVAGIGNHDYVWLDLLHIGIVQIPTAHHPGSEVLHHNVADLD